MRTLKFIGWYLALTGIAALAMLMQVLPLRPQSAIGWTLFFVLALPITLVGELLGEGLWKNRLAKRIDEKTAGEKFSLARLAYAFAAMLGVIAVAWLGSSVLGAK